MENDNFTSLPATRLSPPAKTVRKSVKVKDVVAYVIIYLFLILVCFTCVFPFFWMITSSLKYAHEVNSFTLRIFPESPQWSNYAEVFRQSNNLFRGVLNTLIVEVATIPVCVFISGMSAFAFSKMELKHKDAHLMIQLSALMIPYACLMLPLYRAYNTLNLVDTLWPLILPSLFGGVSMMFFFVQYQRGIPSAIFEAAKVDGAGYMRQYCSIMIPLMGPAIAAQVIFMFVGTWNDYLAPSIYITSANVRTLQIMVRSLASDTSLPKPIAFAGAAVACLPLYVIYIVFQRFFIEGLAVGGVKG